MLLLGVARISRADPMVRDTPVALRCGHQLDDFMTANARPLTADDLKKWGEPVGRFFGYFYARAPGYHDFGKMGELIPNEESFVCAGARARRRRQPVAAPQRASRAHVASPSRPSTLHGTISTHRVGMRVLAQGSRLERTARTSRLAT